MITNSDYVQYITTNVGINVEVKVTFHTYKFQEFENLSEFVGSQTQLNSASECPHESQSPTARLCRSLDALPPPPDYMYVCSLA